MSQVWRGRIVLAAAAAGVLLVCAALLGRADTLLDRFTLAVDHAEARVGSQLKSAGVIAHWDFDSLRPRNRVTGGGVITGGTRIVAGRNGSARSFIILPGEESFLRTDVPLSSLGTQFSFSCWLRFPEKIPDQQIFQYLVVADEKLVLRLPDQETLSRPIAIRGRFFHVAFTVDQAAGRAGLFIDGEKQGDFALKPVSHASRLLCFGQDRALPPATFTLDEASLWERALTPQEVQRLSRLRWSLVADKAFAGQARLWLAESLRDLFRALLLTADLFNPFLHENRIYAAGLPSYALVLSRNDVSHFNQYFNVIAGNGLNAPGTSPKRTVELLEGARKRTAVMELVAGEQAGPEDSTKRTFTLEILADDGEFERKLLLRPIEGTPYLLETLAGKLARDAGLPGVTPELCVVSSNGTFDGLYLAEDLSQDKGPFGRGAADRWQTLLRRLPVFRDEVLAEFDRLAGRLEGALRSDRKSPLTSREIIHELRRQRRLLAESLTDRATRSDEAVVARVADYVREELFLGENPHPTLIVGDLALPPATIGGASLAFASLNPGVITSAGQVTLPDAAPAPAALRVTITSGATTRTRDLSFDVLPRQRRLPVLRVQSEGDARIEATVPALVEIIEGDNQRTGLLPASFRLRGNSVLVKNKGKKVYYRIKLEKPRDVLGAGPTRLILLTSAWRDVALMRDRLCYDLFRSFSEPGKPRFAPHARYVELVVNGDYKGIYHMTDRVDADLLGFAKKSGGPDRPVLYKAKGEHASFMEPAREAYVQKVPDWREGTFWGPYDQLVTFIGRSSPEVFAEGVERVVDVDSVIDFEILLLLRADMEGRNYNLYLARQAGPGSRFFIVPWDCDMSFYGTQLASNGLIRRLHRDLPGYSRRANERWQALRRERLSEKALMERIDRLAADLAEGVGRNYRRWPLAPGWTWEGDVRTLREYLKTRLRRLDKAFQDAADAAGKRGG